MFQLAQFLYDLLGFFAFLFRPLYIGRVGQRIGSLIESIDSRSDNRRPPLSNALIREAVVQGEKKR